MSVNKKYYYLKLVDNFYERDEMIMLESMPDGYMYSNILLKLYLRSLKNEGKLMFNNRIPYNAQMLANVTRFPVAVIEKAIALFKELGLIEVLDNGAIYMLDIQNFIGKSSTEADRKRMYRSKIEEEKRLLGQMSGQKVGQTSDKTPPEIEKEIDIDIDIEKEIEIRKNSVVSCFNYINQVEIALTPKHKEELIKFMEDGIDEKLILKAVDIAVGNGKRLYSYIKGILNKWIALDIKTIEQLELYEKEYKNKKSEKEAEYSKNKFHNFTETFMQYSEEELDTIIMKGQKAKYGTGA